MTLLSVLIYWASCWFFEVKGRNFLIPKLMTVNASNWTTDDSEWWWIFYFNSMIVTLNVLLLVWLWYSMKIGLHNGLLFYWCVGYSINSNVYWRSCSHNWSLLLKSSNYCQCFVWLFPMIVKLHIEYHSLIIQYIIYVDSLTHNVISPLFYEWRRFDC